MMQTRSWLPPQVVLLVAIVSIAVLVVMIVRPGDPAVRLVSRWQPQTMITQPDLPSERVNPPPPAALSGNSIPAGTFTLDVADGLYADQRKPLEDDLNAAMLYVSSRFGDMPRGHFNIAVINEAGCGLHGLAYTDVRTVQVYTCPDIARGRAVAILAHEIVHQLEQDRYGPAHLSADLILAEGTATWGAGKYWLGDQPDFRSYVRAQRKSGVYYPLATHYAGLGVGAMNALYYEWASFVEFLIKTYGREKFDQLYVSGHNDPGSANYAGVYGKPLDILQSEWLAWLDG